MSTMLPEKHAENWKERFGLGKGRKLGNSGQEREGSTGSLFG